MSTPLNVGSVVGVQCWTTLDEQAACNTFYYKVTAIGGAPALDKDIGDAVGAIWGGNVPATQDDNTVFQGTYSKIVPVGTNAPAGVLSTVGATSGTSGSVSLPRQTSGLISWYTGQAGRAYRGRSYIPFPSQAQNGTDGFPNGGYTGVLAAVATALLGLTAISASGRTATIALVIRQRKLVAYQGVVSWIGRPVWATQRRRGSYGRSNKTPFG